MDAGSAADAPRDVQRPTGHASVVLSQVNQDAGHSTVAESELARGRPW